MNKQTVFTYVINVVVLLLVGMIAFSVATIAMTKKVNESRSSIDSGIKATIAKQAVPVLSLSRGIITRVYVRTGDEVKRGDLLVSMTNPLLEDRVRVYQQFQENESAQTEAGLARSSLNYLTISAPADGVVGDVFVTEGASVNEFEKVVTLFSSRDVRVLAELTEDQFQNVQRKNEVFIFSSRLGQTFAVVPSILKPDQTTPLPLQEKKIGMFLTFKNQADASSLLNNEDVELRLDNQDNTVRKPADIFVDFWNGLISRPTK